MDDALGVGELQAEAHLPSYLDRLLQGEAVVVRLLQKALDVARHERQDHIGLAILLTEVVDGHDVEMIARRPSAWASRVMREREASSRPSVFMMAMATSRSRMSSWAR